MEAMKNGKELIRVKHALIKASDKTGLDELVPALFADHSNKTILAYGETVSRIREVIKHKNVEYTSLVEVPNFTGQMENRRGQIKKNDFWTYLNLLAEIFNPLDQQNPNNGHTAPINLIVINLYPFQKTTSEINRSFKEYHARIDIGAPRTIKASAENFHNITTITDPGDYPELINELNTHKGKTTLAFRFKMAKKALAHAAKYDKAISDYAYERSFEPDLQSCYSKL